MATKEKNKLGGLLSSIGASHQNIAKLSRKGTSCLLTKSEITIAFIVLSVRMRHSLLYK